MEFTTLPPARRGPRGPHPRRRLDQDTVDRLRANPDEWAVIADRSDRENRSQVANAIRVRLMQYAPGDVEIVCRGGIVYARSSRALLEAYEQALKGEQDQ